MKPNQVDIERTKHGIFATAKVFVPSKAKSERVVVWSKPGYYADEFSNMSDEELKRIAADHWNATNKR